MTNSLTVLGSAVRMLAEVRTIDDATNLIDIAEAARVYARQIDLGLEAQNHAAEIKIRAQRRAGEILDKMEKAQGWRTDIETSLPDERKLEKPPTYADLDITYKDAHYWQRIARMPETAFEKYINVTKMEGKELTTAGAVRVAKEETNKHAEINTPQLPTNTYRIIYADPPWMYGNAMPDYIGAPEDHYPQMSLTELCNLSIKEITDDNAVLFLWVTSPMLREAFEVLGAWGFEYKTSFVWDKVKHNMGHYNSVRHEFLLVCVRGSCQPDVHKLFDSVYSEERTEHSRKPEYFREVIDTIYPNGKRIELFARSKHDGWDIWGNEIP